MSDSIKLIWPRPCAGCTQVIEAGSYADQESEARGVVFHGAMCAALYACSMLVAGRNERLRERLRLKTKLPPTN